MTDRGAAFFDLDRTLLAGASGEVFSEAMRTAGLVSRTIPGERLLYGLFNVMGETLPSMVLARQAVNLAKGRSRATVQAAAEGVADRLVGMVQPFANALFAPPGAPSCSPPRRRTTS
jgi:putative phosphoserine phosphatase/1-acylglycerol-3-phosphate O-acyltransferase